MQLRESVTGGSEIDHWKDIEGQSEQSKRSPQLSKNYTREKEKQSNNGLGTLGL
jgi:hypothetical protein